MKNRFFKFLPVLFAGLVLAFTSPNAALAQSRGGGHFGGGHSVGGARGFSGGGARGFSGGNAFRGGGVVRGPVYRGGGYYGGRYYGGGFGFGYGAPYYGYGYGYAAPAPAPCGYYDSYGYWHADPYCYNGTLGY